MHIVGRLTGPDKGLAVLLDVSKVLLGFLPSGGSQPFVVLDVPARGVGGVLPHLILRHGVEGQSLPALASLQGHFLYIQLGDGQGLVHTVTVCIIKFCSKACTY